MLLSMLFLHLTCGNVEVIALNINASDFVNNVTVKPVSQGFASVVLRRIEKETVVCECVVSRKDEKYQWFVHPTIACGLPVCVFGLCADFT